MGALGLPSFIFALVTLGLLITLIVWAMRTRKKVPAVLAVVLGLALLVAYCN